MAYTYVLLDADDTLFDFVKAERHCIHGVLERCGAASPQAEQLFKPQNRNAGGRGGSLSSFPCDSKGDILFEKRMPPLFAPPAG